MGNVTRKKVFGRSVIIRKRKRDSKPFSYNRGPCFHIVNAGYWYLSVSLRKPRKAVNFGKIVDK